MLSADAGDAILTALWTVIFLIPLFLLFWVMFDAFKRDDLSGWARGGWIFLTLVLPIIGFVIYMIVRHRQLGSLT